MTADTITAIKKALEGVTPAAYQWSLDGGKSFVHGRCKPEDRPYFRAENAEPLFTYQQIAELLRSLSAAETVASMDDDDRTPMPVGFNDAQWEKADEVHHAMALVASDEECVKIIYATLESLQRENEELRRAVASKDPDYCYDPDNWEYTCNWQDRNEVHSHGESIKFGEPMKVNTIINGPTKWVADVPITRDEEGFPDETEIQWFDSEDAARTALSSTGDTHGN